MHMMNLPQPNFIQTITSPSPRIAAALCIMAVVMMVVIRPAAADLDDALTAAGWDEITFEDAATNQFSAILGAEGQVEGVEFTADDSVSIAFYNLGTDLKTAPNLSWQWQVTSPIINTDITKKGGDDRSLVVYVAFPYQPEEASFGEKLKRTAIEALKGKDTPGRLLSYVWAGGAKKGSMVENPYTGEYGVYIFLRGPSASSGEWFEEKVDVRADFIKAFGYEPAAPIYVAIGGDNDDTGKPISASVRDIMFGE